MRLRVLLFLPVLAIAAGCEKPPPPEQMLRPVRVLAVQTAGVVRERTFSGTAKASLESDLSFRVSGTVRSVSVNVGDMVRRGQVLVWLDPTDYQLRVEDAQASLAKGRAEARNAEANLERVRSLYENNNASQNELDAARTTFDSAVAAVSSVRKRLELSENERGYTTLRAPVTGGIMDVLVEVNENVKQGDAVARIASGSAEVELGIPESLITSVRKGQDVTVRFDAVPGRTFIANVTEVGVAPVGGATTFPVSVGLAEKTAEFRPGMAAEVIFLFEGEGARGTIIVPPDTVQEDRDGRFVYVVEANGAGIGIVHRRPVRTGSVTNEGMEVIDGLADGDLLVTAGWSRITDGQQVRLPEGERASS